MVESQPDAKTHLIKHICDISNHAIAIASRSCPHHNTFHSNPFIDWYILFQVQDNAGVDIIRKKYHKYALLLHPDKNKHPKADFAFKLVSEAYACLSDDARRMEFDVKRRKNLCSECVKTPQTRTNVKASSSSSGSSDRSRSKRILARVKARFVEEARVIDKCLKANASVDVFDKEMPVFDPNDYIIPGYPHFRVWRCNDPKWLKKRFKYSNTQQQQMNMKCDSPVFECKIK